MVKILDFDYLSILKGFSIGLIILIASFSLTPLLNIVPEPTQQLSNPPVNLENWANNQSSDLVNYLYFAVGGLNGSSTATTFKSLLLYGNIYYLEMYSPLRDTNYNTSFWQIKTQSFDNVTNNQLIGQESTFYVNQSAILTLGSSLKNFVKNIISLGHNKTVPYLKSQNQIYLNPGDSLASFQSECYFYGNDNVAIYIITLPDYILVYSQSYTISLHGSTITPTTQSTTVYYMSTASIQDSMANSFYQAINSTLVGGNY